MTGARGRGFAIGMMIHSTTLAYALGTGNALLSREPALQTGCLSLTKLAKLTIQLSQMSNFCINCGSRFSGVVNFCTSCGAPRPGVVADARVAVVPGPKGSKDLADLNSLEMRFFTQESIPVKDHHRKGDVCLVFTNLSRLRLYLGAEYVNLESRIARLVNSPHPGVNYLLLDCSNSYLGSPGEDDWANHVTLLRSATEAVQRRLGTSVVSVFIIGDEEVVPMPCFQNLVGPDDDVDTDYPYASMSADNPWEAMEPASMLVGRLPAGSACGGEMALKYLDGLALTAGGSGPRAAYGIGAEKWQGASRAAFSLFSNDELHVSPPVSVGNLDSTLSGQPDLLYFNLHGSNEPDEPGWFGESLDGQYPVAIRPEHFARMRRANIVGVEACYGAKFAGLSPDESSLLRALGSGTLGFVGSSRIAFGPPEPPINLADVVIGHFLKNVSRGESLGRSHMNARHDLWDAIEDDAHSRLTILEFNLFGDPNFVPYPGRKSTTSPQAAAAGMSAANRLVQSIRAQAETSRRRISKIIRKLRPEEMVSAEVQRGLQRCRQAVESARIPLPQGMPRPEPAVTVTEVGGKRSLVLNYEVKSGPVHAGCSVVQDFSTSQIKGIYVYR